MTKSNILNFLNFKNSLINFVIFFFVTIVFVNQIHLQLNSSQFKKIEDTNFYSKVENFELKTNFSKDLTAKDTYIALNRECNVTGQLSDRHKVRWVKAYFLKNFFMASEKINDILPYYTNILLHSFLIFLTIIILNKTFLLNHKYTLFLLFYVTFFMQSFMSEYSYSIFEMFFFSLALYASKNKNVILFVFSGVLAVLNRESGFVILLSWLLFNKDYKKLIIMYFITGIIFLILNFDILKCLLDPEFFVPLANQEGQTDIHDIFNINLISFLKLLIFNFFIPFGLAFYFLFKVKKYNKILLILLIIYMLIFIFAASLHHVSLRLIILPLIITAIHFYTLQNKKINNKNFRNFL